MAATVARAIVPSIHEKPITQHVPEKAPQQSYYKNAVMKEALVISKPNRPVQVTVHDARIPVPKPKQVLIKVVVSGCNPKDWKLPEWSPALHNTNSGDDIAGIVQAVGSEVDEFRVGDRVGAFHQMRTEHGSFAEFAIAEEHATFHLPRNTTFEEAATIPLAAMTAAIGCFQRLALPVPWVTLPERRSTEAIGSGIVVYGAASAVGSYAIKLLRQSNIHPIIAVAGRSSSYVETLIDRSKGDTIIDYRAGPDAVVTGIKTALNGGVLKYAFDAVADHNSWENIGACMQHGGRIALVLPGKVCSNPAVELSFTEVNSAHHDNKTFAHAWFRLMALGLKDGCFTPHPYQVIPGGLSGVQTGLQNLKEGKASAVKYVVRIGETEGAGSGHTF